MDNDVTLPKRPRGRPRKPRLPRQSRAQSPFLPTRKQRDALPAAAALRQALEALPDVPDMIRGTLELADLPIQVPGVRMAVTEEQAAAAQCVLKELLTHNIRPYGDNSRRSIRSDWRHWMAFCAVRDRVAMPIAFADLKEFLDALIEAGYKRATLDHLLFTLKLACQLWSCPAPTGSLAFRWYWQQMAREKLTRFQHQAPGLNIEDLEALAKGTPDEDPRALRDLAFAAVAYDLMARASELVAMRWDGIDFAADPDADGAVYTLLRSKTDQEGQGSKLYLTADTVRLLQAWNVYRFPENPYVFHALPRYAEQPMDRTRPLAVREVSRIFDRVARRIGVEKPLSGHSARVGGAQDMTRAGMGLPAIMQTGRWKSPSMPARYAANELASRAGKSRTAALRKLSTRHSGV